MIENIEALENIAPESISDLFIIDNPLLSQCNISNICQYLLAPGGTVEIYNNAPGCNSPEELEEACLYISVPEYDPQTEFTISPNPFGSSVLVEYALYQSSQVIVQILDLSGREILGLVNEAQNPGEHLTVIDGTGLKPGVYFCILKTGEGIQAMKMMKL